MKMLQQRTRTPPFMAQELLDGTEALHLYRHDVESLLYITLILATYYDIHTPMKEGGGGVQMQQELKELPYQAWFSQPSYKALAPFKHVLFSKLGYINLSLSFKEIHGWLLKLLRSFSHRFMVKQ